MEVDPRRLREVRDQVIRYIYEKGAHRHFVVPEGEVAPAIGASWDEVQAAIGLMVSQGLFGNDFTYIGAYGLSERGQIEAERLSPLVPLREPDPVHSVTVNSTYSIVQVAGSGSSQNASFHIDQSRIGAVLDDIERELPSLPMDEPRECPLKCVVSCLPRWSRLEPRPVRGAPVNPESVVGHYAASSRPPDS